MANLAKLEFKALDVSGDNYLSWQLDAKLHLQSQKLDNTIKENNAASSEEKAKALIFLRHHIHDDLKAEYICEEDPYSLWTSLMERFDHQRMVMLPAALNEWLNLRFQDFKTVREYNSTLFNIVARLKLCKEKITDQKLIEKTLSTFHASNVVLQQQYRERKFEKYSDLVSCLLVAEANSNVLLKNHNSRPTGTLPIPEINASFGTQRGRGRGRGHGRGRGRGRARGRGRYARGGRYHPYQGNEFNHPTDHKSKGQIPNDVCYRCGKDGHWAKACRAPKNEVDRYNAIKKIETNLMEDLNDTTHLECSDFFEDQDETLAASEELGNALPQPHP